MPKSEVLRRMLLRRAAAYRKFRYDQRAGHTLRANLRRGKAIAPISKLHTIRERILTERGSGEHRAGSRTRDQDSWANEFRMKLGVRMSRRDCRVMSCDVGVLRCECWRLVCCIVFEKRTAVSPANVQSNSFYLNRNSCQGYFLLRCLGEAVKSYSFYLNLASC